MIHSDTFENVKTDQVDRQTGENWNKFVYEKGASGNGSESGEKSDLDVHTAKRNTGDGAHARVFDRDTGGFVSRGSYRKTPSSSSSSSSRSSALFASRHPIVSRRDSHFLEKLTPSVDPCRRRSPTVSLSPLHLTPPPRITKATKVDDTKVETRFSFSMLCHGGPFLVDSATRSLHSFRQNDKAV